MAIGSSASSSRNMGVFAAMAVFVKYRSAVFEENSVEMKQLIWLKIETMNEDWVKFWRVFVWTISQVFAFR